MIAARQFCSNVSRRFCALITGAPGSGKGTISSRIVRDFGLVHLSSGDVLRLHVKQSSELGVKAKDYIDQGALVPNDLMVELMTSEIERLVDKSWLLDGFPRTIEQAKQLNNVQRFDLVINLDVPFREIKRRIEQRYVHLSSGRVYHLEWNPPKNPGVDDVTGEPLIQRDDDKPETVDARLNIFHSQMAPVLQFYSEQGILQTFSGTESDVIYPEIKEFLKKILQ